jgi:Transposase
LAYFDTGGVSNGLTEAVTGLIKKINRVGHGYRNFANYRLLLHCGITWRKPCRPDQRATTLGCVEPSNGSACSPTAARCGRLFSRLFPGFLRRQLASG